MIECSFADPRDDTQLFGHMTPSWIIKELLVLQQLVVDATLTNIDNDQPLHGLTVIITHIKPSLLVGVNVATVVASQLKALNTLGINFIVPSSTQRLLL